MNTKVSSKTLRLRRVKRKLSGFQNHRCCYCHDPVYFLEEILAENNLPRSQRRFSCLEEATFEHLEMQSKNGSSTQDNLVIACHLCNSTRGERTPEKYYEWVQENLDYIRMKKYNFLKGIAPQKSKRYRKSYCFEDRFINIPHFVDKYVRGGKSLIQNLFMCGSEILSEKEYNILTPEKQSINMCF